ncbi:MAG: pimeloyl-ACP methyl ester carboxylesterase [Hyphomicrobiaceae bacterium]|jgi:pimeloyl-ACP methyl ester carboxylesterase
MFREVFPLESRHPDTSRLRPFDIDVPDSVVQGIVQRVADYRWGAMPQLDGWSYGTNLSYMKELSGYWVEEFDWSKQQAELNRFPQFMARIDDVDIHFIYEKGSGPNPQPLIISHGWPGSVAEFLKVIEPLAHPERFGGNIEDAFDVIAPSLPGFGFSSAPPRPYGPRKMADIFNSLMTDVLGYDSYIAQGGDWGGAISSWLGYDHAPACRAIHINILTMRHPDPPQGPQEEHWAANFEIDQELENGYRTQQATKPQTLGYAMMDSPVGVAAWIIEKFNSWSDTDGDDIESAHTKDELLTNIMIYLITGTFSTASWIYFGRREEGGRVLSPEGRRVEVPTACALFPEELLAWPPRSYAERIYNVTQWTEMPRGGHFGAMEEPELMIDDIRAFARTLR